MHSRDVVTVGFDGTPCSRNALTWAAALARDRGVELEVVTSWSTPERTFGRGTAEARTELEGIRLGRIANDVIGSPGLRPARVRLEAVEGTATDTLVDRSRASALLVMGLHGHRSKSPTRRVGATARACLRDSIAPVVLLGAGPPPPPPRRLVLMGDEAERDPDLVRWATRSAASTGLELTVLAGPMLVGPALEGVWSAIARETGPADILVVGRTSGPVPSVLLHRAQGPVLMVPTELTGLLSGPMALPGVTAVSTE
jgi:nucleotide-binding universal stress UspA family protein